jgi:hypothetical protein
MNEHTTKARVFAVAGFCSGFLTLVLGTLWAVIFVVGAGIILATALFTVDGLLWRGQSDSMQGSRSRRILAGIIVSLSYPSGVVVFIAVTSLLDGIGINTRNLLGLSAASVITSFGFYWAITVLGRTRRAVLLQLLLIALLTALISGLAAFGKRSTLIVTPHFVVSLTWVALLLLGETGFAWVWGKARRSSFES